METAIWQKNNIINIRHLYYFLMASDCGSLAAASHKVYVSQPAITQSIKKIESWVGVQLLTRGKSGVQLTDEGRLFKARIIHAFGHLQNSCRAVPNIASKVRDTHIHISQLMTAAQLRALIAVVTAGSFAGAAKTASVSLPTLHRSARELEKIFQVPLFERTSHGIRPTRLGEIVSQGVSLFFYELQQGMAEIDALKGKERGITVMGAMPLARSFLVPQAVNQFYEENMTHRVSILEGTYESLIGLLKKGEVDFLIGALRSDFDEAELQQEHLFNDPLSIIMRPGHPLARAPALTRKALAGFPWIVPRIGTPLYSHFRNLVDVAQSPRNIIECNSLNAARVILNGSDRLMLLSDSQTRCEQEAGMLVSKPHPDGDVTRSIGITSRRHWKPTSPQKKLVDHVRKLSMGANSQV